MPAVALVAGVLRAAASRRFYFVAVDQLQSVELQRLLDTWKEQMQKRRCTPQLQQQQLDGGSSTAPVPALQLGSGPQFAAFINNGMFELKGNTKLMYRPWVGSRAGRAAAVRPMTQRDIEEQLEVHAAPRTRDSAAKRPALQQQQQPAQP